MIIHVKAHQLVDPDPADELEFMEEMVGDAPRYARVNPDNIGSNFNYALRMLGFRAHLNKPKHELVAALEPVGDGRIRGELIVGGLHRVVMGLEVLGGEPALIA